MKNFLLFIVASFLVLSSCSRTKQVGGIAYQFGEEGATVVDADTPYAGKVVIPDSVPFEGKKIPVVAIAGKAFKDCKKLVEVVIPAAVASIGSKAFSGCSSLRHVECQVETPLEVDEETFEGVDMDKCTLMVPLQSAESYSNMPVWNKFLFGAGTETVKTKNDNK